MKVTHAKILHKDKQEILIKDLTAMYKMKNTFLTDKELIQICYDSKADKYLKVKHIKNLI